MGDKIKFINSPGNVFADLGLENPEELALKSDLIIEIKKLVKDKHLTQRVAATTLGITQPTLSKVFRGDIDRVSLETLFAWLKVLGKLCL